LDDAHLFYKSKNYWNGSSIAEWEKRYWIRKIEHTEYKLYGADIDTTFCLVNKEFRDGNNGLRIAGDFTCKYTPWYDGFYKLFDKDEFEFYKENNISPTILKMITNGQVDMDADILIMFSSLSGLINKMGDFMFSINNMDTYDTSELKNDMNNCINVLTKHKLDLYHIIDTDMRK
jgi:hypothetical protein